MYKHLYSRLLQLSYSCLILFHCLSADNLITVPIKKSWLPSHVQTHVNRQKSLFRGIQKLRLRLACKDREGNIYERTYQAKLETIGFKAGYSFNYSYALLTDNDFWLEPANKVIILGHGVEITLGRYLGLSLLYVSFVNAPGGLILISGSVGITYGLDYIIGIFKNVDNNTSIQSIIYQIIEHTGRGFILPLLYSYPWTEDTKAHPFTLAEINTEVTMSMVNGGYLYPCSN